MKHSKYKKRDETKKNDETVKEMRIEKSLEPTEEPVEKHIDSVPVPNPDNFVKTKQDEPIKEMHAEIASVSANLAKKEPIADNPVKETSSFGVPIAIVIAGILVAGSILYSGSRTPAIPKDAKYENVKSQLKKNTIAEEVGLNKKAFIKCLVSGKYANKISASVNEGLKAGVTGTPYPIIVTKSGNKFLLNGTKSLKETIDLALAGETKGSVKIDMLPVTEQDHILGNQNAEVMIVEYSDTECPYCKQFHQMMIETMKTYGTNGNVAWVYRHFPLDMHPKARKEAEATECANELGGNAKFWEYVGLLLKVTPSNNGLDASLL